MIDFHTHILPGMDDGSQSVCQSVEMLTASSAQGVDTLCATPHFYGSRESVDSFIRRRNAAQATLEEACAEQRLPKLLMGAEAAFYCGISNSRELEKLCIGESRCILIDMPYTPWTAGNVNELYRIAANHSLTPIIAHVERCQDFTNRSRKLGELMELGAVLQLNAECVISRYTRKRALELIKTGFCVLGSDCHDPGERPPNLWAAATVIETGLGKVRAADFFNRGYGLLQACGGL